MPPKSKREPKQITVLKDYQITFGSLHGRRVLTNLMKAHYMLGPCFVKGDSHESALREGERNVILRIFTLLKEDPIALLKRIEAAEREKDEDEYA